MTTELRVTPTTTAPNLADYDEARATFRFEHAREELDGLAGGGINIAHEAVVRHVRSGRGAHPAIVAYDKHEGRRVVTYAELDAESARFANALTALGIEPGDAVFVLAGRVPELFATAIGTLRFGAVFCPLFSAFGPEPIETRLGIGRGRVLVTDRRLYQRKVAALRERLPALAHVILLPDDDQGPAPQGTRAWAELVTPQSPEHEVRATTSDTPALLHFTSGTTGAPKGALHVHEAVVVHYATARMVLDLHDDDVYWCTADPGWVTGTSYGLIAPLACGVTLILDEADFDVERWYAIIERERVNVFYTAPTAIRMLMRFGPEPAKKRDLSSLRICASVGEPLAPEGVRFGAEVLGQPFLDTWWQTETGGIMIANVASEPILPGSMGRPVPGIEAAIVREGPDGHLEPVAEPNVEGELALVPGWPSMFRTYLDAEDRYARCFRDGYYLSGDLAKRDEAGVFWFIGRADDLIKTAGHFVGPFEVEAVLVEHPAVAEAGVIGKPDPVAGEIVKAFVALKPGVEASPALERELYAFARKRLGPAVAPREISIVESLPRTRSGKILRRLLKARELGLPEGDTSTLEAP